MHILISSGFLSAMLDSLFDFDVQAQAASSPVCFAVSRKQP